MADIRRQSRADRRLTEGDAPTGERRAPVTRELRVRVVRKADNHAIVYLSNEFVTHNYYLFDEALERLSSHKPGLCVEVELSHVPYADSDALARLLVWSKKLSQAGASLTVVNPMPYVMNIIEALRLDRVLSVVHKHSFPNHPE